MNEKRIILKDVAIDELVEELNKYFEETDIDRIIDFLDENQFLSKGGDEYLKKSDEENTRKERRGLGYVIPRTKYFVNIKLATITAILFILDHKVTGGVAATAAAAFGNTGRFITSIEETNGEKCIVRETLKTKNRILNICSIPGNNKNECINNDLSCKYRNTNYCTINNEEIKKIAEQLIKKNVFEKYKDSYRLEL